jgi:mycothiol synthase
MKSRPMTHDDFPAVARLCREDEEQLNGRPSHVGESEVHEWTSLVDLPNGSWLYEDERGPAAVGWSWPYNDVAHGIGAVHPRAKRTGLGSQLLDRSERVGYETGLPRMHQFALGTDSAAAALMVSRGYRDVRHFYDMAIDLDERPEVPDVAIETLREGDERAFHAALDEAFQDHWEHRSSSFEEWWRRRAGSRAFDPALWFVIRDGDEIVAIARNEANRNGGGYVGHLGVRRSWRGRGYAKALLLHTFREFWNRGFRRVTLGVDAESPTGATRLYEGVGMRVESETIVFEKALTR